MNQCRVLFANYTTALSVHTLILKEFLQACELEEVALPRAAGPAAAQQALEGSLRRAAQWVRRSCLVGFAYYLPEQLNSFVMGFARA